MIVTEKFGASGKVTTRMTVLREIDILLTNTCSTCPKRAEMNREFRSRFAYIDGYCNKKCPVGKQLQELGKKL